MTELERLLLFIGIYFYFQVLLWILVKNFEAEVRASLKKVKCFWFRIQDTNDVSRFVRKAVAEKQPADFYGSVPRNSSSH